MSAEIRFHVDQDLSTGLFGDGGALQHDAAVLLAGQAWSRGRTSPAAGTGTAVDALAHLATRASLEAEGSELEWSTLNPDLGKPPMTGPRRCHGSTVMPHGLSQTGKPRTPPGC
ncbi:hypothetical protein GCM10014719_59760 [Planomonospora parontospora subsp. antibiotica]|nr:hypothetical protein GCM10014719_59760 [Planomonospora parontospora subsp. antibiotica]GII18994.1 hypothetical protein Ppa05_57200 [Planomonospora parontospora subsp. antibiotica]